MSWEFRRNLWIQLTPHRLIATPLVLGLLFLASIQASVLPIAPETLFWLFAGFWGTRRAADSIMEEVIGATWQSQRMAAIGAWSMTWGKLFGATAFAWYGAALSWIAFAATIALDVHTRPWMRLPSPGELLSMLVFALLAQSVSMLVALIQMRRRRRGRQFALGLAQIAGLSTFVPFFFVTNTFEPIRRSTIWWYGFPYPTQAFLLFAATAFFAWALLAVHQLMRAELQYRDATWRLPLFALFLMGFITGFIPRPYLLPFPSAVALAANGVAMLSLFYVTLLAAPGEPIALLRWARALRQGSWRLVGELMPPWLPVGVITLAVGLMALRESIAIDLWVQSLGPQSITIGRHVTSWIAALMVFAARDALVVVLFAVGRRPERADINAVIALAILHGVVPVVLTAFGFAAQAGLTAPLPGVSSPLTVAAAALQTAALGLALAWRFARLRPAPSTAG
ncbi:MAG: hypothetical protein IT563_11865 [Alphaproteobacteria bacterium]|nr:hypothetical protein [Alphaproteobacteria bacterium]